jgi:hypothetical protein
MLAGILSAESLPLRILLLPRIDTSMKLRLEAPLEP